MNNEIKEIIEIFKNITNDYSTNSIFDFEDYEITCLQVKSLLDYITNLQEENKELNDDNIWWNNRFKAVQSYNGKWENK